MFVVGSESVVGLTVPIFEVSQARLMSLICSSPESCAERAVGSQFDSWAMIADIWATSHPPGGA